MSIKGTMIAASVAGLFAMGATGSASAKAGDDEVMCAGVNSCKGTSACKGAGHACAGQNGCKGHGQLRMTKEECKAKGGKVEGATAK